MDDSALLAELRSLETELHRFDTRRNRERLEQLLHAEFVEVAPSGRRYGRNEVLDEFSAGGATLEPVDSGDFALRRLAPESALVTYWSAHKRKNGDLYRHALRASLWVRTADGWRLLFHQGTAVDAAPTSATPATPATVVPAEATSGSPPEHRQGIRVVQADLAEPRHLQGLLTVLASYAGDPAGGGEPLPQDVLDRLPRLLREQPNVLALLALDGEQAVGIAVCFYGLSTFRARPLLNIHDLAVLPAYRRRGVGKALLAAAEAHARRRGCCRLTLEVQDANVRARALYAHCGFEDFVVGQSATRFLLKRLEG